MQNKSMQCIIIVPLDCIVTLYVPELPPTFREREPGIVIE